MKKKYIIITILSAALLSACADSSTAASRKASTTQTVNDILQQGLEDQADEKVSISTPDPTSTPTPTPAPVSEVAEETEEEPVVLSTTEGIDIDLTSLSSTLVYSEVYNMMYMPEEYIGKTIKMEGSYSFYRDETSGAEYYSCIIKDATACCAQGIEFIPGNPEAVPAEGEDVTVVGVFDTYMEGDYLYATLRDATIL
ncbi:MAG: hypothetical protein IKR23_14555 [Lachnospiraceae bacterium]|nr:hypothetical protein [Lachnospiraceae bacterium]